jgi:hypothetical protein
MIALKSVPTDRTAETSETYPTNGQFIFSIWALAMVKIGS